MATKTVCHGKITGRQPNVRKNKIRQVADDGPLRPEPPHPKRPAKHWQYPLAVVAIIV